MSIALIVNILAIINVLIVFLLLYFRKENALPNKVLAVAFLIPGLYFFNTLFILLKLNYVIPFSVFFVQIIAGFFPIMLFYYFNLLTGKGFPKNKILFGGSLLLLLYISGLAIQFMFFSPEEKTAYIQSLSTDDYPTGLFIYTVLFYAWQLVYFTEITKRVIKYRKQLYDRLSNVEQSKYYFILRFIIVLWIFNAILVGFYIFLPLFLVDYIFLPLVVNLLYYFILYFSYHHNAVFTSGSYIKLNEVNEEVSDVTIEDRSEKIDFTPSEKHLEAFTILEKLLSEEHIYRDADLSMRKISHRIGIPEYIVSQAINHYSQKSFFDLINENRIKDVKKKLVKMSPTETIEGIGYDAGFNSRSSFYRAFNKHVGQTPKQFIDGSKKEPIQFTVIFFVLSSVGATFF